jgi:hypothetical protein
VGGEAGTWGPHARWGKRQEIWGAHLTWGPSKGRFSEAKVRKDFGAVQSTQINKVSQTGHWAAASMLAS